MKVKSLSHVQLFVTSWTVTNQASPSLGFSRQEYWSGLPFPSSTQGLNPILLHCRPDALPSKPPGMSLAQLVKNPPAMQENLVRFLGQKDPLEKGKATHSSILAWTVTRVCGMRLLMEKVL